MAVVLLGGLMPEGLRVRMGGAREKLGGALAIGLAVYNFARWWSYKGAPPVRPVNPLAVRKIEPGDPDYNPALDFNRPVVVEEKPASGEPPKAHP
jgi:hypothetical protein